MVVKSRATTTTRETSAESADSRGVNMEETTKHRTRSTSLSTEDQHYSQGPQTWPTSRTRSRSSSISSESSPYEVPVTEDDRITANLIRDINRKNEAEKSEEEHFESEQQSLRESWDLELIDQLAAATEEDERVQFSQFPDYPPLPHIDDYAAGYPPFKLPTRQQGSDLAYCHQNPSGSSASLHSEGFYEREQAETHRKIKAFEERERARAGIKTPDSTVKRGHRRNISGTMNYQNYLESPAGGPSPNPRQAPPSPSQNMNHANGMTGGAMGMGSMVGFPTPAGHQSDLNHIMGMVEELSRQLNHNQQLTANVVDKIGKVREKASTMDLTNDELIAMVSKELNEDTANLEKECADLRKKLEKSDHDKDENWKLAIHGCNILSDLLEKTHKFKEQHEIDTLTWHKNYRKQLSDEREENLALRNQINDMKAAAARAQGWLRKLRRALTDDDEMNELRIQNIALRQEKRFWKRMAMPHLPDDDSEFSDDDDLIDPEEKKRLLAIEADKEAKDKEGDGETGQGQGQAA